MEETLYAKKSLGQHFLRSQKVLNTIKDRVLEKTPEHTEVILEIGPGEGVLTEILLSCIGNTRLTKLKKIIAVEKDHRAITMLQQRFADAITEGKLVLIEGDILELMKQDFASSLGAYALIANIPYYITGAIFEAFLENHRQPNHIIVLIQEEVADRIIARDGFSILSNSVAAFGTPKKLLHVPRGAFVPPPNVESALLEISNISQTLFSHAGIAIADFFKLIKKGFAHKRKKMSSNIHLVSPQASAEKIAEAFEKNGISQNERAENITVQQWIELTKILFK